MFSETVLDHFQTPRNAGKLPNATASVDVSNPVCGDILYLAARTENGLIPEARFLCQGCTTAIACASLLTVKLTANRPRKPKKSPPSNCLSNSADSLPPHTMPPTWPQTPSTH